MEGLARTLHPAMYGLYFVLVLVFTMIFLQPVCILLSWLCAVSCWFLTRSGKNQHTVRVFFITQFAVIVLMTLGNVVFSSHGQTVLFALGDKRFYGESALYGLSMGCMLAAVLTWFSVLEAVISPDEVRQLGGRVVPTVSLMLSMMLAYFPHMLFRGRAIQAITAANTAAFSQQRGTGDSACLPAKSRCLRRFLHRKREAIVQTRLLRVLSVLLGWSLEDSLIQASSMRARGFGSTKRSCFYRWAWRRRDSVAVVVILILGASAVVAGYALVQAFSFYPSWSGLLSWYYYVPYALFLLLPVVYCAWLRSRSVCL